MPKTKRRARAKIDWHDYPEAEDSRSGCKVSWRIYSDLKKAEACAKAANHNGRIAAGLGYDFGYQCPGYIHKLDDGRYEVTLP